MKRTILIFTLLLIAYKGIAQLYNYENGEVVNDFTVTDIDGNTHNLYTYTAAGKYVFIDFFYAACGGCQSFMPVFNEFYDKYGCNEGDVVCISINSGADKDLEVIEFENTYGGPFYHAPAVSIDGGCETVIADFNPMYYPAKCVIGPDNTMIESDISPYDSVEDLEAVFPVGFDPQPMNCSLSTEVLNIDVDFSIFPNPTNGNEITIRLNGYHTASLTIFNILGEKVFSDLLTSPNQKIFPNLNKGIYLVSIQNNRKTIKKTHKLIVN